ncbi:hypothetical protein A2W45_01430 [Candidatus Curtissbacteria bacterium RIFCSPHIGHO2_12_41_11]|uniref:Uncharacterized protein n=3 Tax=Candidatus Curtissiibacteriota TaxID=1752717 RepID=A0A1F5HTJ9_9BACT|nr:MAG: hypothetical protein UU56_C0008G0016 [Candidatus Curtissbacteria bacterium GW2011_GWA2_41_24]OGD97981.1 MAG: hypothetical protein A2W45_01430 [Candidatus Curtissbacteria bacterium RIFCSPHIGHO2_12_41_11]OGE07433.1 MAG: hypothetical protein A2W70_03510 [Candidatus Curtissbacteria bacterium RIFCSPLOWO2_02_41_11]
MADGLPPGEGPETPPQVGPEAPGSPTPPVERQETFQQLQARLAAERTAKAAQERGPGEALEELAEDAPLKAPPAEGAKAEGPTEGNLTPEQIDEIAKRLNEPNADRTLILGGLPDNQLEAVMSRVKELRYGPSPEIPPAIRVEPMDLKAVEASVAEAKTRRLAREAAAGGATGKGQIPEPEAAAAGGAEAEGGGAAPDAAEAPTEEPVGGPAAEAAAAGGEGAGGTPPTEVDGPEPGAEEPEGPRPGQPPEEVGGVDQLGRQITQEATREAAKLERISRMSEPQRERQLNILNSTLDRIMQRQALTLDQNEIDALEVLADRTRNEINLIESAPPPTEGPTQRRTTRVTAEQLAEADRKLKANLEDLTNLSKKSAEELGVERTSEEGKLEALKRMQSGPLTAAESMAVETQIRDSEARVDAIDKLKTKKEPLEQKTKEETEAKLRATELQELQGKVGPVAEIQGIVDAHQGQVNNLKAELKKNAQELAEETDEAAIERLKNDRRDLEKRLVEVGNRLVSEKEALAVAQKREREEKGLEQMATPETVSIMSVEEFNKLSPAEQTKYFIELGNAFQKPIGTEYTAIKIKLINGQNLSFKEAGQLVRELSESLLDKAKVKEAAKILKQAGNYSTELAQAVLDRVTAREDFQKALSEKYPNDWQRILRFAKKHSGWLMILLLIIAAGAATAGAAVAPLAGAGVGVVGTGAGAGGVFGLGRRV